LKRRALPFALLLTACGGAHDAPAKAVLPPVAPSATSSAAAAPVARETRDPEADARVAEALALVSRVRGLAVKRAVPGVRLDRSALRAEMLRMLDDETPSEVLEGNSELLFALDTVPAGFDFKASVVRLYTSELAGFYDPKKQRMVLMTDLGEDGESITLYHELVHALQDQHFNLTNALDWQPDAGDTKGALHTLVEGDATAAMTDVFAAARGAPAVSIPPAALRLEGALMQVTPNLRDVPGIITRSLIAPYADGLAFVNYMREHQGGWAGVDAAFRRAPVSTEQVLHPDRYLADEAVTEVPPIEVPAGFEPARYRDVMGEQGLRILFEEWLPAPAAAEAASDWGGDRLAVFSAGDQRLVRWHLVFDTEPAARRALKAFARGAVRPEMGPSYDPLRPFADPKAAEAAVHGDEVCLSRPQRGAFAAVRHGRHVGVSLGPYVRGSNGVQGSSDCAPALAAARLLATAH
jgi:hypothetical protein